jgi:regulator of replication initiation timing
VIDVSRMSPELASAIAALAESRAELEKMVLEERIHRLELAVDALERRLGVLEKREPRKKPEPKKPKKRPAELARPTRPRRR